MTRQEKIDFCLADVAKCYDEGMFAEFNQPKEEIIAEISQTFARSTDEQLDADVKMVQAVQAKQATLQ